MWDTQAKALQQSLQQSRLQGIPCDSARSGAEVLWQMRRAHHLLEENRRYVLGFSFFPEQCRCSFVGTAQIISTVTAILTIEGFQILFPAQCIPAIWTGKVDSLLS